jgi:hypothetical protein
MKTRTIIASLLLAAPLAASASDWTLGGVSAIKHIAEDKILVDLTDTPLNQPNCVGGVYEFIVTDPAQIRLITGLADRQPLWFKGDGTCVGSNERLKFVGFDNNAPL